LLSFVSNFCLDRNLRQEEDGVEDLVAKGEMSEDDSAGPDAARPAAIALSPVAQRFVLHWGEMGSRWGVNRTQSQIHALLFILGRPLQAEEIADTIGVARSNVSNSLRELQSWKLIRLAHVMGDRRDHFETARDVWDLFKTVVAERKAREFEPTVAMLRACVEEPGFAQEPAAVQRRVKETLVLMESLSAWGDEMLRLDPDTLMKVMKLGARIQKLLRQGKAK
jgi:DNA-binding transcriptional regulator GbsR (MarR family)